MEHTGDLFVFVKNDEDNYFAYILETEEEIETFLAAFALSPADTGAIIQKNELTLDARVEFAFSEFLQTLIVDFPSSVEMSAVSRRIFHEIFDHKENITQNPDGELLSWIEMEYRLFRKIEFSRYRDFITRGFASVEQFIEVANMVLNRRKSRAGKSLEHHLAALFDGNDLAYQSQPRTEGNKKPDFLFPGEAAYRDSAWTSDRLIFLGAKLRAKIAGVRSSTRRTEYATSICSLCNRE